MVYGVKNFTGYVALVIAGVVLLFAGSFALNNASAVEEAQQESQQNSQQEPSSEATEDTAGTVRIDSWGSVVDLFVLLGQWVSGDNSAEAGGRSIADIFNFNITLQFLRSTDEPVAQEDTSDEAVEEAPVEEPQEVQASGGFYVSGSQIIAPDGSVFYPIGVNVNGPESWNNSYESLRTVGHAKDAKRWGFNTVRLTMCLGQGDRNGGDYPDDVLEDIVDEYTAENIVVMLEGRYDCWSAGAPPSADQYVAVRDEFMSRARQYADNPYVWFNLFNEPTRQANDPGHDTWRMIHTDLARDIRSTGATNILVVDGSNYGQENHGDNGYSVVDTSDSAILKYGDDVIAAAGSCNVVFSFHVYTEWKEDAGAMARYIDDVQRSDKALLIGEVGRTDDYNEAAGMRVETWENHANVQTVYDVAPDYGVGVLAWHGAATDSFNLVTESNGPIAYWAARDDFSNLTEFGKLHRNLAANPPAASSAPGPAPTCQPV